MAKGIIRKIDYLGRVVIPKTYRDTYGVQVNAPLGMFLDGSTVVLIKPGETFVGIVRNLDDLGRYTIPIEVRRSLNLNTGDSVDIFIDRQNDAISLRKDGRECAFCGADHDLLVVEDTCICLTCAYRLMEKVQSLKKAGL